MSQKQVDYLFLYNIFIKLWKRLWR